MKEALKRAKWFSAPGPDGTRNEMFDANSLSTVRALSLLFNAVWKTKHAPDVWKGTFVSPLFKQGEKDDPANYRPIALMSCLLKVFERVIDSRLRAFCELRKLIG